MQLDLYTNDSAFYISMNPNQDHFTCTRNAFYLSLLRFRLSHPSDTEQTIQFNNTNNNRFNKCAAQGIHHEDEAEVDPVDLAIHAYSKLISILIRENRQEEASYVVEFLKMNITSITPESRLDQQYQKIKMITFMLLGDNLVKERDNSALRVSPELFNEFMQIPRVQEIILSSLLSSLSQNSGNRGSHMVVVAEESQNQNQGQNQNRNQINIKCKRKKLIVVVLIKVNKQSNSFIVLFFLNFRKIYYLYNIIIYIIIFNKKIMASAAVDTTTELAKKIATLPELPFNDGYVTPDFSSSQVHAMRDPNVKRNFEQSLEGSKLYNLFDEGEIKEFYEMYVDPATTSLAKFYFFNEILGDGDGKKNEKIHHPLYARINSDIRRQLIEPASDLTQMFMHTLLHSRSFNDKTDAEKLAAIQDKAQPGLRFVANLGGDVFLQELGQKMITKKKLGIGGKRHSKFKRKSKKVNRKKSRRRHRRSY